MSPEIDTNEHNEKVYSEAHSKLLSGLGKEELKKAYADFAPFYSNHGKNVRHYYQSTTAKTLFDSLDDLQEHKNIKVLDIACGTGVAAEFLVKYAQDREIQVEIVGVDFCKEMMDIAGGKNLYSKLIEADVYQDIVQLEENSFDALICTGLFVAGQCGPECLPIISNYVKKGGLIATTIRRATYVKYEKEYFDFINKSGVNILKNFVDKYHQEVDANYLLLQKY